MTTVLSQLRHRLRKGILGPENDISTSPLGPVIAESAVKRAERRLGLRLPGLLRRLYTDVANGGFGPGYGLFHISTGKPGATDLVGSYLYITGQDPPMKPDSKWRWPLEYVPVFSHGCGMYEVVDCSNEGGRMIMHNPDILSIRRGTMPETFAPLADSLEARLASWLEGRDLVRPILQGFRKRLIKRSK